jgi:hypothetical protein
MIEEYGPSTGFARAVDQLVALFGSCVSRSLRPLVASNWSRMTYVGERTAMRFRGNLAGCGRSDARIFWCLLLSRDCLGLWVGESRGVDAGRGSDERGVVFVR